MCHNILIHIFKEVKMGHAVFKIPSPPHPASQDVETGFSFKSSFSFLQVEGRKRGKSRVWDKDAGILLYLQN